MTKVPEIVCSVGGAVLLGGLLMFAYALSMPPAERIYGVIRYRAEVGVVGGSATVIGAGLLLFGILLLRHRNSN